MPTCELVSQIQRRKSFPLGTEPFRWGSQPPAFFHPCSRLHRKVAAFQFQKDNGSKEGTRRMMGYPNQPLSTFYPTYHRTPFQAAPRIKH